MNIPKINFSKSKFSSGRFLLTIASAFCFIWFTVTICTLLKLKVEELEVKEIMPYVGSMLIVLSNIFTFYFTKKSENGHVTDGPK